MIVVLPKWKIVFKFHQLSDVHRPDVTVWVSDNYCGNVLRKVADIQFSQTGFDEPVEVIITKERAS